MTDDSVPAGVNPCEILYRLRGVNGDLLYVGITRDWPTRMKQHQADKPWWSEVAGIELVRVLGTRQQIEAIEKAVIKAERPIYNVVHNERPTTTRAPGTDGINAHLVGCGLAPIAVMHHSGKRFIPIAEMSYGKRVRYTAALAEWLAVEHPDHPRFHCARCQNSSCQITLDEYLATGRVQCVEGPMPW